MTIPTPSAIKTTVCDAYGVPPGKLRFRNKHKRFSECRQVTVWFMRERLTMSYRDIATELGYADHTAAMHAHRVITRKREASAFVSSMIDSISERLAS